MTLLSYKKEVVFITETEMALTYYDGSQYPYVDTVYKALKEQQKREKGCEFCNDMKYMPFEEHEVYIDGNGKLDVDDDEDFQLNFCPMCGRPLREAHHEA